MAAVVLLFKFPLKTQCGLNSVLNLKHHSMEPKLQPRAPNTPIFGGACSSQPWLSEHTRVHRSNSRQKPGVAWDSRQNCVLTLKHHYTEPMLHQRALNVLIVGGACRSQPGLFEHTRVLNSNSHPKSGVTISSKNGIFTLSVCHWNFVTL